MAVVAPEAATAAVEDASASRWTIYVTIALSGACALGAEVVWTRLMGMMLGAQFGARLSQHIGGPMLVRLFALALALAGLRLIAAPG